MKGYLSESQQLLCMTRINKHIVWFNTCRMYSGASENFIPCIPLYMYYTDWYIVRHGQPVQLVFTLGFRDSIFNFFAKRLCSCFLGLSPCLAVCRCRVALWPCLKPPDLLALPVCDTKFLGHTGVGEVAWWVGGGTLLSGGTAWCYFCIDSSQNLLVPKRASLIKLKWDWTLD